MTNTIPADPTNGKQTVIYTTPEYKIGKTIWRLQVYEKWALKDRNKFEFGLCRYTRYQWFTGTRYPGDGFLDDTKHPRYDHNDGTWAGLPHGLRTIFYAHQTEIESALHPQPAPEFEIVAGQGAPQYTFYAGDDVQLSFKL